jgi:hypothetical protein
MNQTEQALLTLNYRLTSKALTLWNGKTVGMSNQDVYDGLTPLLTPEIVRSKRPTDTWTRREHRVFHTLLGHYLQYCTAPFENELFTWMRGAAADVNGEKIYFRNILSWCQKRSNVQTRRILEKESSSLCKLLKPFSEGLWEFLLELLLEEFGYHHYAAYCSEKKQIDHQAYIPVLQEILQQTQELYFQNMEAWAQKSLGASLRELNRFDAIYLLGLEEFDHHFPDHIPLKNHLNFFGRWEIDVNAVPGLFLHIDPSSKRSGQAMTFALRIPEEVHVVINPQGGWIDLETLFHEMAHALSHTLTSPDLSPPDKDFFTSNALSETYAFLLQNMCFSPSFLQRQLGLSSEAVEKMSFYKTLKDLSVFRRYIGKFLAEHEMFEKNDVGNGNIYAALMKEHTGFSYRAETHLFDLAPEFYALDYLVSWMAEATLEKALTTSLGEEWMFKPEAGEILKECWSLGNRYEVAEFFSKKGIGPIDHRDIVQRWKSKISRRGQDANHSQTNHDAALTRRP